MTRASRRRGLNITASAGGCWNAKGADKVSKTLRAKIVSKKAKIAVIGLLQRAGQVFTSPVDSCTKDQLLPVILAKVKQGADIYTDGWTSYDALAIYGFNHKKVKHDDNEFSAGDGNHINGIESFWSFAKRRLAKFNGIRKAFFSDYLLETEWRFNHRDTMEPVLKQLVRNDRRTPL